MKNKRREYTRQFYKGNHIPFLIALLATLLVAAQNLWITWILQQLLDAASGVPGALGLRALVQNVLGILLSILVLDALRYVSKPAFSSVPWGNTRPTPFRN